jgi:hypothetical protein
MIKSFRLATRLEETNITSISGRERKTMKAPFSAYLTALAPGLKQLIQLLRQKYDYVSVLSTDSVGFQATISQRAKSVSHETMTTERGTVVRVCRNGLYSEAAFTGFDPDRAEEAFGRITEELEEQFSLPGEDLIRGAAKKMGFSRMTAAVNALFSDAAARAEREGRIRRSDNGNLMIQE